MRRQVVAAVAALVLLEAAYSVASRSSRAEPIESTTMGVGIAAAAVFLIAIRARSTASPGVVLRRVPVPFVAALALAVGLFIIGLVLYPFVAIF